MAGGSRSDRLDEIHKHARWRNLVKGLFDKRRREIQILVTGSARLDPLPAGGIPCRGATTPPAPSAQRGRARTADEEELETLLELSGFPGAVLRREPDREEGAGPGAARASCARTCGDLERVTEIGTPRAPRAAPRPSSSARRLPQQPARGSSASRTQPSCAGGHPRAPLLRLPHLPLRRPAPARRQEAAQALPLGLVARPVARRAPENLVASHLLKWCHFERDTKGRDLELTYFRDIDGREVDFVVLEDRKPIQFVECKSGGRAAPKGLRYSEDSLPED
jgi:hypothetical protein